ncbi:hypothetical protein HW555_004137, partial [Spodoptera exigua]
SHKASNAHKLSRFCSQRDIPQRVYNSFWLPARAQPIQYQALVAKFVSTLDEYSLYEYNDQCSESCPSNVLPHQNGIMRHEVVIKSVKCMVRNHILVTDVGNEKTYMDFMSRALLVKYHEIPTIPSFADNHLPVFNRRTEQSFDSFSFGVDL